jgi:hypothetical protein
MCSELSWCVNRGEFAPKYITTVNLINEDSLSDLNKQMLRNRFIPIVNSLEIETKRINFSYILFQTITTIGSILVPALLSTEEKSFAFNSTELELNKQSHNIFWLTWGISIAVTISNAFNHLLGMERKYILRNINLSLIKKEGWIFLEKSIDIYKTGTHDDIIHIFWNRVEILRHEQIVNDLSYDRLIGKDNDNVNNNNNNNNNNVLINPDNNVQSRSGNRASTV